jgi:uncharacterized protein YndB with AHSA1/START domain
MDYERVVDIDAPAGTVWDTLTAVERWPEWTTSMSEVRPLDPGPFRLGARFRIQQPRLPAVVWEVTDLVEGRSFTWTATSPGIRTEATHELVSRSPEGTTVTLRIRTGGVLAPLLGLVAGRLTRTYVDAEADGLRGRCEGR